MSWPVALKIATHFLALCRGPNRGHRQKQSGASYESEYFFIGVDTLRGIEENSSVCLRCDWLAEPG
jgi:hypothetical protein